MPLEPTREQQGAWLCVKPRDLGVSRGAFDINAFAFGGLGATPGKPQFFSFPIINLN